MTILMYHDLYHKQFVVYGVTKKIGARNKTQFTLRGFTTFENKMLELKTKKINFNSKEWQKKAEWHLQKEDKQSRIKYYSFIYNNITEGK